jgi:hypothetical protein
MIKEKESQLSKSPGMTIRKERWIKGRKDSIHLSSGIDLKKFSREAISKQSKNYISLDKEAKTTTHKVLGR